MGETHMNQTMTLRLMGLAALAGLLVQAGCGGTGHARYNPPQDEARAALEAALSAWRDGRPFGPIDATPPVRVADSLWQGGQQIESFEIGAEVPGDDGAKRFPVKLTMKKAKTVREVNYVVNGRDPVWVFSELDYKRMIDMGNGPEPARNKASRALPGRR
jgi:hypothetical protein